MATPNVQVTCREVCSSRNETRVLTEKFTSMGVMRDGEEMETLEETEVEAAVVALEATNITDTSELIKHTIPVDVIFDIFSRLPVKSLQRFKCTSKSWYSLIRSPIFATAYLTRTLASPLNRYALLIEAHNKSTSQRHFLSASYLGGSTTHLFTLPNIPSDDTATNHVNGVALFHSTNGFVKYNFAFIINPSTHEVLKLPGKAAQPRFSYGNAHICYFLGFDPSTNEFKVLNTRVIGLRTPKKSKVECGIFNLSSCSWKRIDPVFPFDLMGEDWLRWFKDSVCINGVIYVIFIKSFVIAAFDLREEKFSLIPLPQGAIPSKLATNLRRDDDKPVVCFHVPYLINYNGLLAVICHDKVFSHYLVEMWILEDCDNQLWVKESITIPADWATHRRRLPKGIICTGEVMFTPRIISGGCLQIPFYDMKQRSFRSIEIMLSPEWLASDDIKVTCDGGYLESILHLRRNH